MNTLMGSCFWADWYNANPLECSSSDACNDNVGQGRDTGCQTSNSAVAASQTSPARNNKGKSTAAVQTLPVENSNVCKTTNHNEGATAPGSHTGALPKRPQTPKKLSKKAAKKQVRACELVVCSLSVLTAGTGYI